MDASIKESISNIIDGKLGYERQKDGTFAYEIYADYRDEMDPKTAIKILESQEPMETFWDVLDGWYQDYEAQLRTDLEKEIRGELTAPDGPCPAGLTDEAEAELWDLLAELVYYELPAQHFLTQTFKTDIMTDTGDGNYDYTLNRFDHRWNGPRGEPIDDRAGIVWLAKTQGYTRARLQRALWAEDAPEGFLASMQTELANLSSHMSTVTFLVEMTLEQLIKLNRLIHLQDREGRHYDARDNPYCGYIIIDKGTMAGLYDPWYGGGSMFDIELEKDVKLPVKFIRSALPDGGDGYAVEDVYAMCAAAWRHGGVKVIHAPVKLAA